MGFIGVVVIEGQQGRAVIEERYVIEVEVNDRNNNIPDYPSQGISGQIELPRVPQTGTNILLGHRC